LQDAIVLRPMEPTVGTSRESSIFKSQNEDYEQISEKSASSSVIKSTAAEVNQTGDRLALDHDIDFMIAELSQNQHHYQELNDDTLIPNKQVYQSLERTGDIVAQSKPPVAQRKYETLILVDKPQSCEYQKLHRYANIEDKT
jgi:transcription termination factor Rho